MPRAIANSSSHPADRRGFTLIELLVVITILAIVTAASIPLLTTGVEQRRVREAARLVSSYISSAKARAVETGRPAGVMIQRVVNGGVMQNYAMQLITVEVPPPYAGDSTSSQAQIGSMALNQAYSYGNVTFPSGTSYGVLTGVGSDLGWYGLVRVGDLIRFGYQGRSYVIMGVGQQSGTNWTLVSTLTYGAPIMMNPSPTSLGSPQTAGPWFLLAADGSGATPPLGPTGLPSTMPYQIIRQPTKSAVPPLQLPEGTVVDLGNSGVSLPSIPSITFGAACPQLPGIFNSSTYWYTGDLTAPPGPFGAPVLGFNPGNFLYPNPIITFGPTGGVNLVYYDNNSPQHLTSAMYFLVGRRDGVMDVNPGVDPTAYQANDPNNLPNLFDMNNMWVAVNPQGLVVSTENANTITAIGAGVNQGGYKYQIYFAALAAARQFAQASSSMGGR